MTIFRFYKCSYSNMYKFAFGVFDDNTDEQTEIKTQTNVLKK